MDNISKSRVINDAEKIQFKVDEVRKNLFGLLAAKTVKDRDWCLAALIFDLGDISDLADGISTVVNSDKEKNE